MNIISTNIGMLRIKEKLLNNKLTKGDVSNNIQFICENASTDLKVLILERISDLSADDMNKIALSISSEDEDFISFFRLVNMENAYRSTEEYLVGE